MWILAGLVGLLAAGGVADVFMRYDTAHDKDSDTYDDDDWADDSSNQADAEPYLTLLDDYLDEHDLDPVNPADIPLPHGVDLAPEHFEPMVPNTVPDHVQIPTVPEAAAETPEWSEEDVSPADLDAMIAEMLTDDQVSQEDALWDLTDPSARHDDGTGWQPEPNGPQSSDEDSAVDNLFLEAGDDGEWLYGGEGDDNILGGADNDTLVGGAGNDTLHGGDGDNLLLGGEGDDLLHAGSGNDELRGQGGNDLLVGGEGDSTLLGGEGDDTLHGGSGDDLLSGGWGDDLLVAGPGDNLLNGGAGNDTLVGAVFDENGNDISGRNYLNGGAGDDLLILGSNDIAHGGDGADDFILGDWIREDASAMIQDYDAADDRIMVVYDPESTPVPELSVLTSTDDPEDAIIMLNGVEIAVVSGGAGLTADDIDLVTEFPDAMITYAAQ